MKECGDVQERSRTCFIHVGTPKTGTSFLQGTFFGSRESLAEHGFELVPSRRRDHLHLALQLRQLIRDFDAPRVAHTLDRMAADLDNVAGDTILVTQESLAPTSPAQAVPLMELLDGWDVHVIVTARDIARQVPSGWQQRIQGRATVEFERFVDAVEHRTPLAQDFWINHDVPDVVARWSQVVGAGNVHLITCPPSGTDRRVLLERFCGVVGVDPGWLSLDADEPNTALGQPQAELQRRVNVALGDRVPHMRAGYIQVGQAFLAGRILRPQAGPPARLPARMRPWAERVAEEWASALLASGCEIVGDLDELRPRDGAFVAEPVTVSDAELVEVSVTALADILAIRDQELRELAALRRELGDAHRRLEELRGIKKSGRALAGALRRRVQRMSARQRTG